MLINFIKKETLAQVFSCEFLEMSKKTFSYRARWVAASGNNHDNVASLKCCRVLVDSSDKKGIPLVFFWEFYGIYHQSFSIKQMKI